MVVGRPAAHLQTAVEILNIREAGAYAHQEEVSHREGGHGLHHHNGVRKGAYYPVSQGKAVGPWLKPVGVFGYDKVSFLHDFLKLSVGCRIARIQASRHDGCRLSSRIYGSSVGNRVYSPCKTAYDGNSAFRQPFRQLTCHPYAVRRAASAAYYGYAGPFQKVKIPSVIDFFGRLEFLPNLPKFGRISADFPPRPVKRPANGPSSSTAPQSAVGRPSKRLSKDTPRPARPVSVQRRLKRLANDH